MTGATRSLSSAVVRGLRVRDDSRALENSLANHACARGRFRAAAVRAACLAGAFLLAACSEQNSYVPPPPPKVDAALPLKQTVTRYLTATGNSVAINNTTVVARVQGFIQSIDYKDGDGVSIGKQLFLIEPAPYQLALESAKASQAGAVAQANASALEYQRQADLLARKVVSQAVVDQAAAQRDSDAAKVEEADANTKQAELNLGYTQVMAPFDGVATARQVSMGQLVGSGGVATVLASVVQLNPIYVTFTISEPDVLRIRANMLKRGMTTEELKKVPVEVGLQTETGYSHRGTLDYAAPEITASTGTLLVRAVLDNPERTLLPGYFVRVRVPLMDEPDMLLVPDRAVGADQSGRYLLVVGKDDTVEQRTVTIGDQVGELRVIETGINPDDRVVISGTLSAVPGQKVDPQMQTLPPAPVDSAAPVEGAAP